jgi:diphthamide synthase subunit DPH2
MEEMNKLMESIEREIIKKLSRRYNLNTKEVSNYIKEGKSEVKRGRPKKEVVEENKKVKGARGRPAKEEKEECSYVGEDLIERLINMAIMRKWFQVPTLRKGAGWLNYHGKL